LDATIAAVRKFSRKPYTRKAIGLGCGAWSCPAPWRTARVGCKIDLRWNTPPAQPPRTEAPRAQTSHDNRGRIRGIVTLRGAAPEQRFEPIAKNQQGVCGSTAPLIRLTIGKDDSIRGAFLYTVRSRPSDDRVHSGGPSLYVATSGDNGKFVIDVPAGTYPIKMWHEGVRLSRVLPSTQLYEHEDPYEATAQVAVKRSSFLIRASSDGNPHTIELSAKKKRPGRNFTRPSVILNSEFW